MRVPREVEELLSLVSGPDGRGAESKNQSVRVRLVVISRRFSVVVRRRGPAVNSDL